MAITLGVHASAAGNSDVATTAGIDTTGADFLVIASNSYDTGITFSDSKGNTWTSLTEYGGGAPRVRFAYCLAPTVGSGHTFTGTSVTGFPAVAAAAFSVVLQVAAFDQQSGAAATQPGSVTPGEDNELLLSAVCWHAGAGTLAINSSFTKIEQADYIASQSMGLGLAYKIQTTAGAENPTWSGVTMTERASNIATFKAAGAAAALLVQLRKHGQTVKRAAFH